MQLIKLWPEIITRMFGIPEDETDPTPDEDVCLAIIRKQLREKRHTDGKLNAILGARSLLTSEGITVE